MLMICRRLLMMFCLAAALITVSPLQAQDSKSKPRIHVVPITGAISPATYDLVKREIAAARTDEAVLIVLQMDTPGGLYDSTQQIVQAILDSPIPVASYVSPAGAHAASAGTYILYASHLAVMAPSTRLGAATPIMMDGDNGKDKKPAGALDKKMVNDASAFIRGLAERYGRNAEWAERAVRDAESLTASEAVSQKVADMTADNLQDLASKANGRSVKMADGSTRVLKTADAEIVMREPGLRHSLLEIISHPNIALLLMTLGTYGLIYEFASPGTMIPGVIGAIFLLLGLYAINILPVNYSGLALLMLGLALMTAEAFTVTFGILGIGGAIAFICGAVLLMQPDALGSVAIDPWLIITLAAVSFAVLSVSLGMVVKSLRTKKVTGVDEILDATATVVTWQGSRGEVLLTGEVWQAQSITPHILTKGAEVRITALEGLVVTVTPVSTLSHPSQGE